MAYADRLTDFFSPFAFPTNRYYARALLTCLHRSIAVPEWAKLRRGEPVSLERALGAFDLFIPESGFGDLDEVRLEALSSLLFVHSPRSKADRTLRSRIPWTISLLDITCPIPTLPR